MNTPGQSTVAATLDAIDAATEQRCACGCGQALAADGPSAWFATPDCQRAWHERHVTDPDDVYDRHDAADYVGVDSAAWPLNEPGEYSDEWLQAVTGRIAGRLTAWLGAVLPGTDMEFVWEPAESDGPPYAAGQRFENRIARRRPSVDEQSPEGDGAPYTHMVSGGGTPTFTVEEQLIPYDLWPAAAQQVRLYAGSGAYEAGTLTPDPDGDVMMASGRYAFEPANLCREHARERADEPPADPMERALWLRRNRNTGPRRPQRAPRRIDPRRSR